MVAMLMGIEWSFPDLILKHLCWISLQVKKHIKNGKNVSMGFGFVEFDSVETATSVCKDLQVPLPPFDFLSSLFSAP